MQRRAMDYLNRSGGDDFFDAEQNARLVKNAEEYYRSMFRGRQSSWNLRDQHMFDTLETVLGAHGPHAFRIDDARVADEGADHLRRDHADVGGVADEIVVAWMRHVDVNVVSGRVHRARRRPNLGTRQRTRRFRSENRRQG